MRCKPIRGTTAALDGEQGSRSAHLKYMMTADSPSTRNDEPSILAPTAQKPGAAAEGHQIFRLVC